MMALDRERDIQIEKPVAWRRSDLNFHPFPYDFVAMGWLNSSKSRMHSK
jgi:hypothetical protein